MYVYVGSCSGAVEVSAPDRFALTPHHWQLCGRQRIQPIQRNSGGRLAKISPVLAAAPTSGPIPGPLAARRTRPSQTDPSSRCSGSTTSCATHHAVGPFAAGDGPRFPSSARACGFISHAVEQQHLVHLTPNACKPHMPNDAFANVFGDQKKGY
jgi:hypothetical protein